MIGLLLAALVAYLPASGSLLRRAADRAAALGKARDVTLMGTLTVAGEQPRNAQLVLRFPGQCTLTADGGLSLSVKGAAAEGNAGPALQLLQLSCPLMTFKMTPKDKDEDNAIRAAAVAAGVDLAAPASLARLVDRAVYVIGGREQSKPQLWLYKDSHAAARLITNAGADLRLLEYGNPAALEWFPRVLELWSGGQLAARFEALEAKGLKNAEEDEDDSE
jgi:hypothetical protein